MKHEYSLENLSCAHCASKIEEHFGKDPNYKNVVLDFSRKSLYFESDAAVDANSVGREIDKIEAGIVVVDKRLLKEQQRAARAAARQAERQRQQHGAGGGHDHLHGHDCAHDHSHGHSGHDHSHGHDCAHDHSHGHDCAHDHSHGHGGHDHSHGHDGAHDHSHEHAGHDHNHSHEHGGHGHNHAHQHYAHQHGDDVHGHDGHNHGGSGFGQTVGAYLAANSKMLWRIVIALVLFFGALALGHDSIYTRPMLLLAYVVIAYDILYYSLKNIIRGNLFDENFLMSVATIGAFAIGQFDEGVAVMIFYQIGEFLQEMAVDKSRRSIAEKMDLRVETVKLVTPDGPRDYLPEDIAIGDIIIVPPNEKLALDGVVKSGQSFMQTASITGEARPRRVVAGDVVLSGFINGETELTVEVTTAYEDSTVSKIIELVERASGNKAKVERFITRFAKYYTPAVVFLALAVAILPTLLTGAPFKLWLYRSLIFLVVSCPCALVLSIPLGFFAGLGAAARAGIVIKGGNYLEQMVNLKTIVFDKTGTLTKGNFKIAQVNLAADLTETELLALAVACEGHSSHPIGKAIVADATASAKNLTVDSFDELAGRGIKLTSGSDVYSLGSAELMADIGVSVDAAAAHFTVVHIAKNDQYLGNICLADEVKDEAAQMIAALDGVKTVLISGDAKAVAEAVGNQLGVSASYGNCLPADKLRIVEQYKVEVANGVLAFVGDGSNDAPVLAAADVGLAMGGVGTDVALEAADMMIMEDNLAAIPKVVAIAKMTMRIIYQNVILALGIKFLVMALGVFGLANMWMAVFADVGVTFLAVLNALRILWRRY